MPVSPTLSLFVFLCLNISLSLSFCLLVIGFPVCVCLSLCLCLSISLSSSISVSLLTDLFSSYTQGGNSRTSTHKEKNKKKACKSLLIGRQTTCRRKRKDKKYKNLKTISVCPVCVSVPPPISQLARGRESQEICTFLALLSLWVIALSRVSQIAQVSP